ncbi:hypothetical protein ACLKA6_012548 [Drosophila palustris]
MEQKWLITIVLMGLMLQATQTIAAPSLKPLPAFVKVCHRDSPDLNTCARESFESLKPRLMNGIPELFIPPMEPLTVPEIKMDQDSGAIFLHSTYRNVKITGMSRHKLNDLKIDPSQLKFMVSMTFPKLHLDSQYNMKGKIMMMPLLGDGQCFVDLTNLTMYTEMFGEEYTKDGAIFLKIKDIKVKYELQSVHMQLDNLFNGDKALGQRMNDFINENWKSLAEEVRPLMTNVLVDILRASVDKLFKAFSYDQLLPKMKI